MTDRRTSALLMKRAIDLVGAGMGLIALSPVLAAIALAVWAVEGRPILFRQVRPGLRGRTFTMLKFRSMRPLRPGEVLYVSDDDRLGRLGRFIRATSLDELPELWNVVRGDMSLVGPRPLLVAYLDQYTEAERRRHEMRPGITGWAVVNGRNSLQWKERMRLDVWYVEHWSLRLDAKILAMTVRQVLRRTDVSTAEDLSLGFPLPGLTGDGDDAARRAAELDKPASSEGRPADTGEPRVT